MIDAPLALAFAAGLLAVVNPCGFAMLPAYLTSFVVGEGESGALGSGRAVRRALTVAAAVSLGFAALFAVVALVVRNVTDRLLAYTPWVSVAIGLVLAAFGVALLAGRRVELRIPRLDRGGRDASVRSMVLYGVSYAVVSLGCTLPTFLVYVAGTLTRESVAAGAAVFAAYTAGFTVLLGALTVSLALARRSLVGSVRRTLPFVERAGGGLLVAAGLYVSYYGWYELYRLGDPDPIVDRVTGFSADLQRLIDDLGPTRVAAGLLALVVVAVVLTSRPARRRSEVQGSPGSGNPDPVGVVTTSGDG